MASYFLAAENSTSWPDAIVLCVMFIVLGAIFWAAIK